MTMTKTKADPMKVAQGSLSYLTDLVQKRQVKAGESAAQSLAELTRWLAKPPPAGRTKQQEVSDMIDRVKKLPARLAVVPPAAPAATTTWAPYPSVPEAVPSSKFAILTELLHQAPEAWRKQELLFFEVKKLRGKRVIRRLTGAPGRFNRTALPSALATELFGHLEDEKFAFQASKTFGEHYQVCGRCAAELTDDTSRERKFGPVCWDLMASWRKAAGIL
jgi:hypothetical protein